MKKQNHGHFGNGKKVRMPSTISCKRTVKEPSDVRNTPLMFLCGQKSKRGWLSRCWWFGENKAFRV